jgi:uncharacterized protein YqiB (DUF1249 family)
VDIYQSIFQKMEMMGILRVRQYVVIENPPYLPLCIDRLDENMYAISQNPTINGEMIADPDIEIRVYPGEKRAEPMVYQDRNERKVVYPEAGMVNLKVKNELCVFLDHWLNELLLQGFKWGP